MYQWHKHAHKSIYLRKKRDFLMSGYWTFEPRRRGLFRFIRAVKRLQDSAILGNTSVSPTQSEYLKVCTVNRRHAYMQWHISNRIQAWLLYYCGASWRAAWNKTNYLPGELDALSIKGTCSVVSQRWRDAEWPNHRGLLHLRSRLDMTSLCTGIYYLMDSAMKANTYSK